MIEYLKKFPPFGAVKCVPEDKILEQIEFSLKKEREMEFIIQGFEYTNRGLLKLVKFCDCLETAEEIFQKQGEEIYQNKKSK